uniref:Uncharacterized protein n=1 Tax=Sphaerodactylus townsendi TaxID=933632 RepID=A0ACB8G5Z8_9SAUR
MIENTIIKIIQNTMIKISANHKRAGADPPPPRKKRECKGGGKERGQLYAWVQRMVLARRLCSCLCWHPADLPKRWGHGREGWQPYNSSFKGTSCRKEMAQG